MKKLFLIILILIFFLQILTGCNDTVESNKNTNNGNESVSTTLKIINQSNYNLLQVNYGGVEFGNISSSSEVKEKVPEGTFYIFFYLKSLDGNVYCRTSEVITCENEKSNEIIISNITTIENTKNGKNDSLIKIYDEINTLPASLELRQSNAIIKLFGEYDFGSVIINKTFDVTFTIRNPGTLQLSLTGNPVVDSTNSNFTVISQPANKIDAELSVHFIIRYAPLGYQTETSTITILNDSDVSVFSFTIKGRGRDYIIGDTGPAGGIIFFDAGVIINGFRFFEAAPLETEVTAQWGAYEINVAGTQTGIGTGKQNTILIIAVLNQIKETGKAAQICDKIDINSFNDWFLPSAEELNLLYKNLKEKGLGDFNNGEYWSSSQGDNSSFKEYYAWYQNFNTSSYGFRDYKYKNETKSVRAIRSF